MKKLDQPQNTINQPESNETRGTQNIAMRTGIKAGFNSYAEYWADQRAQRNKANGV